jgi:AcrR family transcriptional regulator
MAEEKGREPAGGDRPSRTRRAEVTRQALLVTAEALFASEGIEATSMRAIALAAGQSNVAAVQYHFGDKQTLLSEIFEWRAQMMEPRRREMAARAGAIETCSMRELLAIVFLPYLDMRDRDGRHVYARLLLEYLTLYGRFALQHPAEDTNRHDLIIADVLEEFYRRMGSLPEATMRLYLTMITTGFLSVICEHDLLRSRNMDTVALDALADQMLDFMAVALEEQGGKR